MKRTLLILIIIIIICIIGINLTNVKYPELDSNAISFKVGEYVDNLNDNEVYATIEYNNRTYILYGGPLYSIKSENIDKCIGYIIQDNEDDTTVRVYTLTDNENNDYLMVYDSESKETNFYRAIDTLDNDILTPKYITSYNYNIWN